MSGPALDPSLATQVAGWYGKIPALGDFASRRLPASFVDSWDAWLQRSMLASRSFLREQWQEIYLNSPIWRFALLPGVLDDKCWIGIMMPSADRVGRYFPLSIALPLEAHPDLMSTVFAAQNWFAAIEQIALASLSMDFQVTELEGHLGRNPLIQAPPKDDAGSLSARELARWWSGPGNEAIAISLPDLDSINSVLSASGINMLSASGFGKSLWWSGDELSGTTQLRCFSGLPPDNYFSVLLAGLASRPMSL